MRSIPSLAPLGCVIALLGLAASVCSQQNTAPGQKVIQDPAEYKAFTDAMNTQDAAARAEALEAFVGQYPHSVALTEALQQEMAAWQTVGESNQVKKAAKRLLAADPGNVRVLGIVVALDRVSAEQGDIDALNEMCIDATGGMREVPIWRKPAEMTDADFARLSRLMNDVFIGAEGYCALQEKNYSQAKDWLARAFAIDPTNVQDTYQLAEAELETTPLDANGFWYCARAIHLAQNAAIPQNASEMETYCKGKYAKYHGGEDGWDALVASTAAQDALPRDFAKQIKAAGQK